MVTTRSYCLAPNEFSTVGDIEERLHRVYHLPKPVIKKIGDYFKVEYKKKPLAKYVHNIINAMGWKSKVKDNILTVFTGLLPNETTRDIEITPVVDDKTENTLSPVHTDRDVFDLSIHSVVNESPFFIINSKEEALIELKKLYFDPQLSTELSEETKNDIHFVLQENWKKTHPEEYAIALLDFLKK